MKLFEYQAKELFARYQIPIQRGVYAITPAQAAAAAAAIGGKVVVKAQVLTGGRGKAGGVLFADTPAETADVAEKILALTIKGLPVQGVLVAQYLEMGRELYLSFVLDRGAKRLTMIASAAGGMEIEETAKTQADKIARVPIDPVLGLQGYDLNEALYTGGFPQSCFAQVRDIAAKLYRLVTQEQALVAEINPLMITPNGEVIAVDGKVQLDDNALLEKKADAPEEDPSLHPLEVEAKRRGLIYVKLDGQVGVIGNGAGLVMSTLDAISAAGGNAANFLDIGGGASADVVASALELISQDADVKSLLINIFGGITRCDEVAKGVLQAMERVSLSIPVVLRLKGTASAEGLALLQGLPLALTDSMEQAAAAAAAAAKGGA